jgi:hypothetical protein
MYLWVLVGSLLSFSCGVERSKNDGLEPGAEPQASALPESTTNPTMNIDSISVRMSRDQGAAALVGTVFDARSGDPLMGVRVHVEPTDLEVLTNIHGRYLVLDIPPGDYGVTFSHPSYEEASVTVVVPVPRATERVPVEPGI